MTTYSLFSTSSDRAGFRLNYMEVYNWGTFDDRIFRIMPQGNNSLLTGANASGKSTFIDALLTLLVPVKKDRFYNQSSGIDKKGDRTEETYVLGHYGNIQNEGEAGTSTQKLRDKNCYSVILANFSNTDFRTITLFQVRWFSNGELKRTFGLAHTDLTISEDFNHFDAKGSWKKRLEKQYSNQSKRIIEFFDGPTGYAERFADLLGMRSATALSLFNQVVGVKVLDDLDEFIRNNMLENRDAENEYLQLKASFVTLMEAKTNIEKAKEQINQLLPIDELAQSIQHVTQQKERLDQFKKQGNYWFTKKFVELAAQELEKQNAELTIKGIDLSRLREQETQLTEQQTDLKVQIKSDHVGGQIESLKQRINPLEKSCEQRSKRLEEYNQLVCSLGLILNPDINQFLHNKTQAQKSAKDLEQQQQDKQLELRKLENEKIDIQRGISELMENIQTLQRNQNNITGRVASIRDEILQHTGANKHEIPFIAELIKVKSEEMAWEPAIEKILHSFALRLVIPEKYYKQVNEYVNRTNLKGRIVYQRYQDISQLNSFSSLKQPSANALFNKLEFNPKSTYITGIEDVIKHQFDYACVNSLEEFNHYNEKAVTQQGLIKSTKGKHEKDDRQNITHRDNYILGWDNQEKISLLRNRFNALQEDQTNNKAKIDRAHEKVEQLKQHQANCNKLIDKYEQFDDIDWQNDARQIEDLKRQLEVLKQANDRIAALQQQLVDVETKLSTLKDTSITHAQREIFSVEKKIEEISSQIEKEQQSLSSSIAVDTTSFVEAYPTYSQVEFKNIDTKKIEMLTYFNNQTKALDDRLKNHTDQITKRIFQFKNPNEVITSKFIDWRSDVHHLPDPEHLDLIGEYQTFLEKLQNDNLPKFEKRFNDYLHETITNKVSDFRMFFMNWADSIKENIQTLNDALQEIDFRDKDFKTYIQIVFPTRISDEIKDFKRLLEQAIPNAREIEKNPEAQHLHFVNHIEPFIKKLDHEDWRKKVMQVRFWFSYKAEEFYRENHRKFKTYENMGQLSGGEKAQLTYTILGSAIAYQFGLTKEGLQSDSFRFIAIDEAFKAQDEDKARYLINLCKQLHLQLLVVTPSDNIHIVENDISFVHYVERKNERHSWLYDMPIEQFKEEKEQWINRETRQTNDMHNLPVTQQF
ncbi:SbcC/MukB-like Walker B domain-containing protein [Acinetobacter sp. ASP199]|uniref:ATP-binding protein n=1 Tax=unclassified Acinetobacter TaxID=196816 RepID=UPI001F6101D7|nr:SbcC/MukB-like Walker B domain-containing protein [Acinetobacter sp. ASP199]UNT58676.1 AAA family ATPase [Acinetobacter sp. ASP199]